MPSSASRGLTGKRTQKPSDTADLRHCCIVTHSGNDNIMENEITQNECTDPTESMTIELPCAMIERVQKLAAEKNTTLSSTNTTKKIKIPNILAI